jgi:UDP-N-acetylmuramoylalanine--D-glutamate ligase
LFREHIDYFGSEEAYYQAKRNMLVHMQPEDTYIYNPDFSLLQQWADELPCNKRAIKPAGIAEIDLHNTAIIGDHNKLNILLALEVADIFKISKANALSCLSTFKPLAHRLEKVAEIHDVTYIDDAISTTPESTLAALQAVKNIDCLMLGGLDRGYDFTELAAEIAKQSIRSIVLFPDSGEAIAALFPPTFSPLILRTSSMKDAVAFASKNARPGSTVLLSCASPSYSLWKDFEAKGDDFKQQVLQLL